MSKTIIVPLDGSDFAEAALAPAGALARLTGARVVVTTSKLGGVLVDSEQYLTSAAARAGISDAEVVVISDRSVVGGLQEILADVAEPVLCTSTHGRSGVAQALLGSTAEWMIRDLRVPMLLVGPRVEPAAATSFANVVVCTDGTPESRAIIPELSTWVGQLRLRVWALQVVDPDAQLELEAAGEQPAIEFGAVHAVAEALLSRDGAGVNWDVMHRRDVPDAIVDYARAIPASFIAMATHGRTGFQRLALGSVAASVVHTAPCPVLVVPPDDLADDEEQD
jgi:nucleotide-binding universal stress UspA family protein